MSQNLFLSIAATCLLSPYLLTTQAAPIPVRLEMFNTPTGVDDLYDYTIKIINSTSSEMNAYIHEANSSKPLDLHNPTMQIQVQEDDASASGPTGSSTSSTGYLGSSSSSEAASNYTSSSSSSACEFLAGCSSSAAATCPIDGDNNTIDNSSTQSSLCGSGSSTDSGPFLSLGPLTNSPLIELGSRAVQVEKSFERFVDKVVKRFIA